MQNPKDCLSPLILRALTQGCYSEPMLQWYLWHVDDCELCRESLVRCKQAPVAPFGGPNRVAGSIVTTDSSFDLPCLDQLGLEPPASDEEMARLGDFRVLRPIGSGQSSIVFAAEDLWLNRQVVLKLLRKDLSGQMEGRLVFLAEAKAIAAINHDNVLPILNIGQEGEDFYLVMPMLPGESLKSALTTRRFTRRQALKIIKQVAAGLSAIHKAGLLHCDLKPSNIWLQAMPDGSEKAVILDFGFSAANSLRIRKRIQTDLAPEQLAEGPVDARTDIFSLGRLLLTLLYDHRNVHASSADLSSEYHFRKTVSPVSSLLKILMAHNPLDRPANADAVLLFMKQMELQTRRRWITIAGLAASAAIGTMIYKPLQVSYRTAIPNISATPSPELKSDQRQILATIQPSFKFPVGTDALIDIDYARSNMIVAKPDGHVTVRSIAPDSATLLSFYCGLQQPALMALSPSGQELAIVSRDGHLKIWAINQQISTTRLLSEIQFRINTIRDMIWTDEPVPRIVLAASQQLHLIDATKPTNDPAFHESHHVDYPPRKLSIRPGFQEIVCVVDDGGLMIWDFNLKRLKAGVKSHHDNKVHFATSRSGKHLGTSGNDGILLRYDGHSYPAKVPTHAPYWQAEYVNYFFKASQGMTFVSDSIVMIQLQDSPQPSAEFLLISLLNPKRECIMRCSDTIIRMLNSADQPNLFCLNDKGELLVCDISKEVAKISSST